MADLTWLADINYAQTSGYDGDGLMNWGDANAWVASLDYETYFTCNQPDIYYNAGLFC